MSQESTSSFALTQLTEPQSYADPTPPASPDLSTLLLLGNLCLLTYQQYASGTPALSEPQIQAQIGSSWSVSNFTGFTISEALGTGAIPGEPGFYTTLPVGFAVTLTNSDQVLNVIALRGSQSFDEWLNDATAIPAIFAVGNNGGTYYSHLELAPLGMVHGGFYALYTQGTEGSLPQRIEYIEGYEYSRPTGSIAAQVAAAMTSLASQSPLFVTGHSLGAALAGLAAMDAGTNFAQSFPSLTMVQLAPPRLAAGVDAFNSYLGISASTFVASFASAVPASLAIVHSADIVPILPSEVTTVGDFTFEFDQVAQTVVNFCAQTGDIAANHSAAQTYVPYLQQLADGFAG
jgi:hypothetical protein